VDIKYTSYMYASITVNNVKLYIDILAIPYSLLHMCAHACALHTHPRTHTKICMECAKKSSPFLSPIHSTTNFESIFIAVKILL